MENINDNEQNNKERSVNEKFIELNAFVKIKGLATTGGQAKQLIRSEVIKVNNVIETRNRKKLYPGDIVSFEDKTFTVTKDVCLMSRDE